MTQARYDEFEDAELARLAAAGDRAAFGAVVRRHGGRVHSLLSRRCRDRAGVDDLFQKAMLRAWVKIDRFDPCRGPLAAWLLVVAGRVAVNAARERRPLRLADGFDVPAVEGARSAGDGRGIWAVVDAELSPDAAASLWLRYAEGLTPGQIAAALGRTPVGVRVLLLRSLRKLRNVLENRGATAMTDDLDAVLEAAGVPARSGP